MDIQQTQQIYGKKVTEPNVYRHLTKFSDSLDTATEHRPSLKVA